MKDSNLRPAD